MQIGERLFTDGITRPVSLDADGRQFVLDGDGQEGLEQLRNGLRPDLILLDMLMPGVDGWAFLKRLRQKGHPAVPVVVTTGTILTREWADSNGCQGFLHKPIQTDELLEEVRRCLGAA